MAFTDLKLEENNMFASKTDLCMKQQHSSDVNSTDPASGLNVPEFWQLYLLAVNLEQVIHLSVPVFLSVK